MCRCNRSLFRNSRLISFNILAIGFSSFIIEFSDAILNEEKPIAKILNEIFESSLGIKEKLFSFCNFFTKTSENKNISQYFEVITNNKTVGVMGDFRCNY